MSKERKRAREIRDTEETWRDRDREVLFLKLTAKPGVMNRSCL